MIGKIKMAIAIAATIVFPFSRALAKEKPIECPPVVINISTGVDDAGNTLAVGTTDPHWQNSQGMNNVTTPNSGWSALTGSAWIGNGSTATGNTDFVYTLNFTNAAPATINFTALGDNYVTILLDGIQVAQTPGGPTIYGFQIANAASYSGGVGTGTHTLTATVHNVSGPSGFNLSGSVSYSLVPVVQDLSTGVNGVILPMGAQDPNWNGPSNYVDYLSAWDVLSGSAWIGDASSQPAGTYTYTRSFTIPSPGILDIEGLADNYLELYLDGTPITQTPGLNIYGFKLPYLATYYGSITAGPHTLTAVVTNEGGPMALNIHGSVSYCGEKPTGKCLSNATFSATYLGGLSAQFYTNNVQQINTIVTHYWDFGDGNTSNSSNPSHTYASSGSYLVMHTVYTQVLDEKGNVIDECKDYKECKLVIDEKGDREGSFRLYCERIRFEKKAAPLQLKSFHISPNPAQDILTVQGNNGDTYDLQILSVDGKVVVNATGLSGAQNSIDVSKLAAGTYIAIIRQGGVSSHFRFVKAQ